MIGPKVSILTITYNQEKYIKKTLDSILSQKVDFSLEVIVADDASTDDTPQIIADYAKKYPFIVPVLRKKNIGAVKNSIDTLKIAKGKYIALCEGDDYWTDDSKLQQQVDFLDANNEYAICFHPVQVEFDDAATESSIHPKLEHRPSLTSLIEKNYIPTNSVVFRRQNYDLLPDDAMPLDWFLHLYNAQFGKIKMLPDIMAVYRRHAQGLWWDSHKDPKKLWQTHLFKMLGTLERVKNLTYGSREAVALENSQLRLITAAYRAGAPPNQKTVATYPALITLFLQSHFMQDVSLEKEIRCCNQKMIEKDHELTVSKTAIDDLNYKLNELVDSKLWKIRDLAFSVSKMKRKK